MSWYRCQKRSEGVWLYFEAEGILEATAIARRVLGLPNAPRGVFLVQSTLSPHRPLSAGLTVLHGEREISPLIEGRL